MQDPDAFAVFSSMDAVTPWKYALDGVRACLRWQEEDAWSDYQQDFYKCPNEGSGIHQGTYDLGLLQTWQVERRAPRAHKWSTPTGLLTAEAASGELSSLRAVAVGEGGSQWVSIERAGTRLEVVRVGVPVLEGAKLSIQYSLRDSRVSNAGVARLISSLVLNQFWQGAYGRGVAHIEYRNLDTGSIFRFPVKE